MQRWSFLVFDHKSSKLEAKQQIPIFGITKSIITRSSMLELMHQEQTDSPDV
jgi:hypothetical protein